MAMRPASTPINSMKSKTHSTVANLSWSSTVRASLAHRYAISSSANAASTSSLLRPSTQRSCRNPGCDSPAAATCCSSRVRSTTTSGRSERMPGKARAMPTASTSSVKSSHPGWVMEVASRLPLTITAGSAAPSLPRGASSSSRG